MKIKKGSSIEVDVTAMAFGGRGLARVEGMAVFVDQAVPGDRAVARIVKTKKNYAEARLETLLSPSPERVTPPCPYSGICGGCKWQFLAYPRQLAYKRQHVVDALERIALLPGIPVHPALPSPEIYGYRNKMEFSCSDRRWLLPEEMDTPDVEAGFALGLHVPGTFYKVLDTRACLLQPELGNHILEDVRAWIKASDAPVYGLHSHVGYWRFLMLRHSVAHDTWMVNLITASQAPQNVQPLAEKLMRRYPQIVAVVNNVTASRAGVAIGEYEIPLAGAAVLTDRIGKREFEISANSFFQTNTRGAERLYATAVNFARLSGTETVFDLYSGTGTIAICLAADAAEVVGFEIVASAIGDAEKNCRLNGVTNCRFVAGDIRTSLSKVTVRPAVLVIDPPRAGMHPDVVRQVLDLQPDRIVYVSCNPATLARDLALLKERYRVAEVQPVDMFPHTFHVEAVARLEREG